MDTHLTPRFVSNLAAPAVLAAVHSALARGAVVEQFSERNLFVTGDQNLGSKLADTRTAWRDDDGAGSHIPSRRRTAGNDPVRLGAPG